MKACRAADERRILSASGRHLIRGNVHQPRDVGDSLVRNLAAARREPAVHRIEPEQKSEPELRRATPPRQLLQLITDQRPDPDQY